MSDDVTCAPDRSAKRSAWDVWSRRLGAFAVASVAAYASYQHQAGFALAGGADLTTARLWPFSVDGLLVLSTAGLLRDTRERSTRTRALLWAAFAAGIVVSLAANIATAPSMAWGPILVAGWPPIALLLAVELVEHRRPRGTERAGRESVGDGQARSDTRSESPSQTETNTETTAENKKVIALVGPPLSRRTAEQVMWDHYQRTIAAGLPAPTGAELDAVAGTNNYGRAMLRKWRRTGRTGPPISVAR